MNAKKKINSQTNSTPKVNNLKKSHSLAAFWPNGRTNENVAVSLAPVSWVIHFSYVWYDGSFSHWVPFLKFLLCISVRTQVLNVECAINASSSRLFWIRIGAIVSRIITHADFVHWIFMDANVFWIPLKWTTYRLFYHNLHFH